MSSDFDIISTLSDELNRLHISSPLFQVPRMVIPEDEVKAIAAARRDAFTLTPILTEAHFTGEICAVCQLKTPPLTKVKVNAIMRCGHVVCYECILRILYNSEDTTQSGTDCPICGHHSAKIFLTKETFCRAVIRLVVAELWPLVDGSADGPTELGELFVLGEFFFEKKCKAEFSSLIEALLGAVCRCCKKTILKEPLNWRMFKRSESNYEQLAGHSLSCNSISLREKRALHSQAPLLPGAQYYLEQPTYCQLCYFGVAVLPAQLKLYETSWFGSSEKIADHISGSSGVVEQYGHLKARHVRCTLCFGTMMQGEDPHYDYYFFDLEALLKHAKLKHVVCLMCSKQQQPYTFFKHSDALKEHTVNEHCTQL